MGPKAGSMCGRHRCLSPTIQRNSFLFTDKNCIEAGGDGHCHRMENLIESRLAEMSRRSELISRLDYKKLSTRFVTRSSPSRKLSFACCMISRWKPISMLLIFRRTLGNRTTTGTAEHRPCRLALYPLDSKARESRVKKGNIFVATADSGLIGFIAPTDKEFAVDNADDDRLPPTGQIILLVKARRTTAAKPKEGSTGQLDFKDRHQRRL